MKALLNEIAACQICKDFLPNRPKPVLQINKQSKIAIIGQAPGRKVQESGIPWDDASGNELRRWLDVSPGQFYDPNLFALVPMGFCYPGSKKSGDLPPRPECAPAWHQKLLTANKSIRLTLLIGQYAQNYYLRERAEKSLTENVKKFQEFLPQYLPLVHPSPRNRIWQKKNPWFEREVLPILKEIVRKTIN